MSTILLNHTTLKLFYLYVVSLGCELLEGQSSGYSSLPLELQLSKDLIIYWLTEMCQMSVLVYLFIYLFLLEYSCFTMLC